MSLEDEVNAPRSYSIESAHLVGEEAAKIEHSIPVCVRDRWVISKVLFLSERLAYPNRKNFSQKE